MDHSDQADLIAAARQVLGISLRDLGRLLRTPERTMAGWRAGTSRIPPAVAVLLCLIRDGVVSAADLHAA